MSSTGRSTPFGQSPGRGRLGPAAEMEREDWRSIGKQIQSLATSLAALETENANLKNEIAKLRKDSGGTTVVKKSIAPDASTTTNTSTSTTPGTPGPAGADGQPRQIRDDSTTFPARDYVHFTGAGVTVTDDSGANETIISITSGGGSSYPTVIETDVDYTVLSTDGSIVVFGPSTGVTITITLPSPTAFRGRIINVKNSETGPSIVRVTTVAGSEIANGSVVVTNYDLFSGENMQFQSRTTLWDTY